MTSFFGFGRGGYRYPGAQHNLQQFQQSYGIHSQYSDLEGDNSILEKTSPVSADTPQLSNNLPSRLADRSRSRRLNRKANLRVLKQSLNNKAAEGGQRVKPYMWHVYAVREKVRYDIRRHLTIKPSRFSLRRVLNPNLSIVKKDRFIRKKAAKIVKLFDQFMAVNPEGGKKENIELFFKHVLPALRYTLPAGDDVRSVSPSELELEELVVLINDEIINEAKNYIFSFGFKRLTDQMDNCVDQFIQGIKEVEQDVEPSPICDVERDMIEQQARTLFELYVNSESSHLRTNAKSNLLLFVELIRAKHSEAFIATKLPERVRSKGNEMARQAVERTETLLFEYLKTSAPESLEIDDAIKYEGRGLHTVLPLLIQFAQKFIDVAPVRSTRQLLKQIDRTQFDLFVSQYIHVSNPEVAGTLKKLQTMLFVIRASAVGHEKFQAAGVNFSELNKFVFEGNALYHKPFTLEDVLRWCMESYESLDRNLGTVGLHYLLTNTPLKRVLPIERLERALPNLQPLINNIVENQAYLTFDLIFSGYESAEWATMNLQRNIFADSISSADQATEGVRFSDFVAGESGESGEGVVDGGDNGREGENSTRSKRRWISSLLTYMKNGNRKESRAVLQLTRLAAEVLLDASEDRVDQAIERAEALIDEAIEINGKESSVANSRRFSMREKLRLLKGIVHLIKWAHNSRLIKKGDLLVLVGALITREEASDLSTRIKFAVRNAAVRWTVWRGPSSIPSVLTFLSGVGLAQRRKNQNLTELYLGKNEHLTQVRVSKIRARHMKRKEAIDHFEPLVKQMVSWVAFTFNTIKVPGERQPNWYEVLDASWPELHSSIGTVKYDPAAAQRTEPFRLSWMDLYNYLTQRLLDDAAERLLTAVRPLASYVAKPLVQAVSRMDHSTQGSTNGNVIATGAVSSSSSYLSSLFSCVDDSTHLLADTLTYYGRQLALQLSPSAIR